MVISKINKTPAWLPLLQQTPHQVFQDFHTHQFHLQFLLPSHHHPQSHHLLHPAAINGTNQTFKTCCTVIAIFTVKKKIVKLWDLMKYSEIA